MWMLVHQTMSHQEQVDLDKVFVGVQDWDLKTTTKSGTNFFLSNSSI